MYADHMKSLARRAVGALTAVGLALGMSTALQAQERTEMGKEKKIVMTQQELRAALSQPEVELQELGQIEGLKQGHVVVVNASDVLESEEELVTLRNEHGEVISTFRTELQGNEIVLKALEKDEWTIDDVVAVYVTDRTRAETGEVSEKPERGEKAEPRTGAHKTVYIVVEGEAGANQPDSDLR